MSSTGLKLAVVAALYLLWIIAYWTFTDRVFGPGYRYWAETTVVLIAAIIAFRNVRIVERPYSAFLAITGVGLVLLAATSSTYDPCKPFYPVWWGVEVSQIFYALYLYVWTCAFGYLGIQRWRRRPPSTLTVIIFLVLVAGLAMIVTAFYLPAYADTLGEISNRLDAANAVLEFTLLTVGLACVLIGVPAAINWMVFATAVLAASDILYAVEQSEQAVEPAWMSALFLILSTLIALPDELRRRGPEAVPPVARVGRTWTPRSGLSALLILLSLGTLLLSVAVEVAIESGPSDAESVQMVVQSQPGFCKSLASDQPEPVASGTDQAEAVVAATAKKLFFSIIAVVALVLTMVWITDRFDDTVAYLASYVTRLHRRRLRGEEWRESSPRIRTILRSTGLGYFLDRLRQSARRLRQDVLFLGPERLFPSPRSRAADDEKQCFIVMPFSLEWSDDVHRIVSRVCHRAGVRPVRGDDLFTPTDILNDIWQGIHDADFVIADITGRNANVLYELGIAHTLAKPVLILSRTADDIPIDLSSRRVILYGDSGDDWRARLEDQVGKAIDEILRTYGAGDLDADDESHAESSDTRRSE